MELKVHKVLEVHKEKLDIKDHKVILVQILQ
jgi:hypothetical protein